MDLAIVGGGLSGALAATVLARRGHAVTLYERRPDPRVTTIGGGRSINLALSHRGISALRHVALDEQVMAHALPMRGRMLHDRTGDSAFQSYSADGSLAINSISRAALNNVLLDAAAAEPGVTIRFDTRVDHADSADDCAVLHIADEVRTHAVAIGMDGAFSAVRDRIVKASGTSYSQDALPWGYKELPIPPTADGEFALDPGALHIWPRGHSMMIALPNPDRSFTATLFWPVSGPHGFSELVDGATIGARFDADYADAVPLMPNLVGDYLANPVGHLITVRVWPWVLGRLALLGDAAHAIVPFYGQGMNCSFEDVVELDRCLDETGDDVVEALGRCADRRKPNADAIAEMALDNFVEMRDRVGSRWFRLAKRAEHAVERAAPGRLTSLYELISFSTVPYVEAQRRGRARRTVIDRAVRAMDRVEDLVTGGRR
jgi:kynurenine 3-monooxygenase